LGYLIWNGARSLNLNFFTKLPVPVGEQGGGMANAIVGSGKLLLLASVIGIFVYGLIVLPQHHFSTFAGGVALGIMMIPIALRSTDEFLRAVPNTLREGGLALGASKAQTVVTVII